MIRAMRVLAIAGAIAAVPCAAAAQVEVSGGIVWSGGYDASSLNAMESPNSSTGGAPLTLFTTSARVPAVTGFDARAGIHLGSRVAAEGLFQLSRPKLRVKAGDDFENAVAEDVVGGFSSYLFGGSLVYHLGTGRVVPFVLGGGGYIRLLDEDNADVVTGGEVHAGGGVKVWFDAGRKFGARVDAQASVRSKNPGFEDKRRVLPAVSAGLTFRF